MHSRLARPASRGYAAIMLLAVLAEPLVSRAQVDEARNMAIFWSLFTALLIGLFVFRFVRRTRGDDRGNNTGDHTGERGDDGDPPAGS